MLSLSVGPHEIWEPLRDLLHAREQAKQEEDELNKHMHAAETRKNMGADNEGVSILLGATVDDSNGMTQQQEGPFVHGPDPHDYKFLGKIARSLRFSKQHGVKNDGLSHGLVDESVPNSLQAIEQKYQQAWIDFIDTIAPIYNQHKVDSEQSALAKRWAKIEAELVRVEEDELYTGAFLDSLREALGKHSEPSEEILSTAESAIRFIGAIPEMLPGSGVYEIYAAFHDKYKNIGIATLGDFQKKHPTIDVNIPS
jgi:hypothetical protein